MAIRFYKTPSADFVAFVNSVEKTLTVQQDYFSLVKLYGDNKADPAIYAKRKESELFERICDNTSVEACRRANAEGDSAFINFVEDYQQLRRRQVLYFRMKGSPGTYTREEMQKILGECIGRERGLQKDIKAVRSRCIQADLFQDDRPQELDLVSVQMGCQPLYKVPGRTPKPKHNDAPCWSCCDGYEAINGRFCKLTRHYVEYGCKDCPKMLHEI